MSLKQLLQHKSDIYIVFITVLVSILSVYFISLDSPFSKAASFDVTSLSDSGPGTFREALLGANNGDTITFSVSGTISINSTLTFTDSITASADGNIIIDGSGISGDDPCIEFDDSSVDTPATGGRQITFIGFTIQNCPGAALYVNDSAGNTIGGNHDTGEGNIFISSGGGSTEGHGIYLSGENASDNYILGNYIGTLDGESDDGNRHSGIAIKNGAANNTIGGDASGESNIIYGANDGAEIYLDSAGMGNDIMNNYIGVNTNGNNLTKTDVFDSVERDGQYGIAIVDTIGTVVGGDTSSKRNIISGNSLSGIFIDSGQDTDIIGNYIGVDPDGDTDAGNAQNGIYIEANTSANDNLLIGTDVGDGGNVISGNTENGIEFGTTSFEATGIIIKANTIGLSADGNTIIANGADGIKFSDGQDAVVIGGIALEQGNYISGNSGNGIYINNAEGHEIYGNHIGFKVNGSAAGNGGNGIEISGSSPDNFIGDVDNNGKNWISNNTGWGIEINGANAGSNTIYNNVIGLATDYSTAAGNGDGGIRVISSNNQIGGVALSQFNIISANDGPGIHIDGEGTNIVDNVIEANLIGLPLDGEVDLGNTGPGIQIDDGADGVTIGGSASAANQIAFNSIGVLIDGSDTRENSVRYNSIFDNDALGIDLTNTSNNGISSPLIIASTSSTLTVAVGSEDGNTIDFYYDDDGDGEGKEHLGSAVISSNEASLVGDFDITETVVATITDTSNNTSEFSSSASLTEDTDAPEAPSNLTASVDGSNIVLNWDDNTEVDFDHYEIYRSESSSVDIISDNLIDDSETSSYTDSSVEDGITYYYVVVAYDTVSNVSEPSNEYQVDGSSGSSSGGGSSSTDIDDYTDSDDDSEDDSETSSEDTNTEADESFDSEDAIPDYDSEKKVDLKIRNIEDDGSAFLIELCAYNQNIDDVFFKITANGISNTLRVFGTIIEGTCNTVSSWGLDYFGIIGSDTYEVVGEIDPSNLIEESNEENNFYRDELQITSIYYVPPTEIDESEDTSESTEESQTNTDQDTSTDQDTGSGSTETTDSTTQTDPDTQTAENTSENSGQENQAETEIDNTEDDLHTSSEDEDSPDNTDNSENNDNGAGGGGDAEILKIKRDLAQAGSDDTYIYSIQDETDQCDKSKFPEDKDQDNDGLTESVECNLNTDPENDDSDFDGYSDGEEYLDFASNPLVQDEPSELKITFPSYGATLSLNKPIFQGLAKEGREVEIFVMKNVDDNTAFKLGEFTGALEDKFIFETEDSLQDGTYYAYLTSGNERSNFLKFNIDSKFTLDADFIPESLGGTKLTLESLEQEELIQVTDKLPDLIGKLKIGEDQNINLQLVWHSVVKGAIASYDISGNVSARPNHELEAGRHDLYISIIDASGNQGSYIKIPFEVVDLNPLGSFIGRFALPIYLSIGLLVFGFIYLFYFRSKNPYTMQINASELVDSLAKDFHDKILRRIDYKN